MLRDQRATKLSKQGADELVARLSSGEVPIAELTLYRTQAKDGSVTERWQIDSPKT